MTTILASLLPIALYILVLKLMDSFALVKWGRLSACFAAGALSAGLTFCISLLMSLEIGGVSITPILEEILKGIIVVWWVYINRIKFFAESVIYGAAVGGGFAFVENIVYFAADPAMQLGTAVFRGFDCAFLHIGCTALIASLVLIMKGKRMAKSNGEVGASKSFSGRIAPAAGVFFCLIPSLVLHFAHNYAGEMKISPAVLMVLTVAVFFAIFLYLFRIGEKMIYAWMDHSISIDIQTLTSIRNGNFSGTRAGIYLLGMRDQFQPEVFFDMINYVELFLSMKIERQSMMLMSQAGFTTEETAEQQKLYAEQKVELFALRKNIGKTGLQVLSPLVAIGNTK